MCDRHDRRQRASLLATLDATEQGLPHVDMLSEIDLGEAATFATGADVFAESG